VSKKTVIRSLFVALFVAVSIVSQSVFSSDAAVSETTFTTTMPYCENCGKDVRLTGTVTLTVTPGAQTVKIKPIGVPAQMGVNAAQYTVTGTCEPESPPCCLVSFGAVSWNFTAEKVSLPSAGSSTPVTLNGSGVSRTTEVFSSPAEVVWRITFKAEATCTLNYAEGKKPFRDKNGEVKQVTFPGSVTAWFTAIDSPSPVLISLPSVVVREAKNAPTKREVYAGSVRFADTTSSGNVLLKAEGVGEVELATLNGPWSSSIAVNIPAGESVSFRAYTVAG